jgi:protein-S-isoprenylcysteine O-methyltransferase Ste14
MMARLPFILDPLPTRATVLAVAVLLPIFFLAMYVARPTPLSLGIGLALIAVGLAIRFITNATLRKNEVTTREGLYAICRHPMYVGTIVLAIGIVVALNHPAGIAVLAAAVVISLHRIRKEEQFLLIRLADYAMYRGEVPAFPTPRSIWRAISAGRLRQPLSLKQCFLNGEVLRLNLYLPLLLAAGFFLGVSSVLLAAGAVLAVLVAAASIRFHPAESRRRRSDYFLPAALDLAVLALVLLLQSPP